MKSVVQQSLVRQGKDKSPNLLGLRENALWLAGHSLQTITFPLDLVRTALKQVLCAANPGQQPCNKQIFSCFGLHADWLCLATSFHPFWHRSSCSIPCRYFISSDGQSPCRCDAVNADYLLTLNRKFLHLRLLQRNGSLCKTISNRSHL